jgi:hypothetical protein
MDGGEVPWRGSDVVNKSSVWTLESIRVHGELLCECAMSYALRGAMNGVDQDRAVSAECGFINQSICMSSYVSLCEEVIQKRAEVRNRGVVQHAWQHCVSVASVVTSCTWPDRRRLVTTALPRVNNERKAVTTARSAPRGCGDARVLGTKARRKPSQRYR